jgi:hypothetical protein
MAAIIAGNALLDYVIEQEGAAGRPADLCRADFAPPVALREWVERRCVNSRILLARFFEWYIGEHRSRNAGGRRVLLPGVVNPLPVLRADVRASETPRRTLPSHRIRQLVSLLMDDDWAWAKTLDAEYLTVDTANGPERIWSPVRSSVLALMLLLPLRGFQVRALDSGEGDSEVLVDGVWTANVGPLAPASGSRRNGFLRRYRSPHREWVGFYANTNKSAKLGGAVDKGYELPFEHAVAQRVATDLLAWQQRFNPVDGPTPMAAFPEAGTRNIRRMPTYFLCRDPANDNPRVPPTYGAVKWLWDKLVEELERRLAEAGERNADGSPVVLTRPTPTGRMSVYNLHSLRASHLTHLLTEGKVPLHILSRHVAGHASLVMTLHYIKTDAVEVADALSAAHVRVAEQEQEAFARAQAADDAHERLFVSNDPVGAAAMAQKDVGMWKHMGTGICPVGSTRCGDGGPAIDAKRFAPVPGGSLNCPSCRFHITGPAFLPGLVVRFNATSMNYDWAREELQAAERRVREEEDAQFDREKNGLTQHGSALFQARNRHETALVRVENAARDLQRLWDLIEKSKALAEEQTEGAALVVAGSRAHIEVVAREAGKGALWDAVCQGARFYAGPEIDAAVAERSRLIDRALVRANAAPVFLLLSPEQQLTSGNHLLRLLAARHGRDAAFQVLDGRLPDVGPDLARLVAELTCPCLDAPPNGAAS